jgi:hypothetical protein
MADVVFNGSWGRPRGREVISKRWFEKKWEDREINPVVVFHTPAYKSLDRRK